MPEIGQTVSHYRIIEKMGQGGMGEVFMAHDTSLDRKVAVKFLPDIFSGDPERLARFEREAKLLASLYHPNIAAIYGLEQAFQEMVTMRVPKSAAYALLFGYRRTCEAGQRNRMIRIVSSIKRAICILSFPIRSARIKILFTGRNTFLCLRGASLRWWNVRSAD